jgi:hypothetical protein
MPIYEIVYELQVRNGLPDGTRDENWTFSGLFRPESCPAVDNVNSRIVERALR